MNKTKNRKEIRKKNCFYLVLLIFIVSTLTMKLIIQLLYYNLKYPLAYVSIQKIVGYFDASEFGLLIMRKPMKN